MENTYVISHFGLLALLVALVPGVIIALARRSDFKGAALRVTGSAFAATASWFGIVTTGTGCGPFFLGFLWVPGAAIALAALAFALPKTRNSNILLAVILLAMPLMGLAIGTTMHAVADCP